MTDRDWGSVNEAELDRLLEENLPEFPPEAVVREVTPWRKAMDRALTGLALSLCVFNLLGLNYLLPAIGMMLALLGFRALRRENGYFLACWIVTILQALYLFPSLIWDATIWRGAIEALPAMTAITAVLMVLRFVQLLCLWRGFRAVQAKAGVTPHTDGAVGLIFWFVVVCGFALIHYSGFLGWGMIVAYICVFRSLYKLSSQLDEAGYSISPAPVRVSDRAVTVAILTVLTVGILCGYLFGSRYPMEWAPVDTREHTQVESIKTNLLNLGYPADLLNDLSVEDIAVCEGATQVLVIKTEDYPVNEGREVRRQVDNTTHISREYDVKELRITGIAVKLPGEREEWRLFHHFQWVADPGFWGTESIQLWPTWHGGRTTGWAPGSDVTGRVLYDRDGVTYTAPYWSLESVTFISDSVFWGHQTYTDPFAAFSFPRQGGNRRGYLTYSSLRIREDFAIDSWVDYTHQRSPFQYPVQTAKEYRQSGVWGSTISTFKTVQDQIWFYPQE